MSVGDDWLSNLLAIQSTTHTHTHTHTHTSPEHDTSVCYCFPHDMLRSFIRPLTGRLRLKCDGTRAQNRFRLSAKRTILFKSVGASVQSTTGSRVVRISGSNAGYTMFQGSVKSSG